MRSGLHLSGRRRVHFARNLAIAIGLACLVCACVMNPTIPNLNLSYSTIRAIVVRNLPGGLRGESINGRELISSYYQAVKQDKYILLTNEKAESAFERDFTKVVILGDRRPYAVQVMVYRQRLRRGTKQFMEPVLDEDLTEEMADRIRSSLANRRDDSSVIDDFRAF